MKMNHSLESNYSTFLGTMGALKGSLCLLNIITANEGGNQWAPLGGQMQFPDKTTRRRTKSNVAKEKVPSIPRVDTWELPHPRHFHHGHQRAAGIASGLQRSPMILVEYRKNCCLDVPHQRDILQMVVEGTFRAPRLPQRPKLSPPYCGCLVGTHTANQC